MANKRPQTPVDNPFPTRAEDVVNKGLRAGIDAVPVLGSNLVEFFGLRPRRSGAGTTRRFHEDDVGTGVGFGV